MTVNLFFLKEIHDSSIFSFFMKPQKAVREIPKFGNPGIWHKHLNGPTTVRCNDRQTQYIRNKHKAELQVDRSNPGTKDAMEFSSKGRAVFSHVMPKLDFHYFYLFSWKINTLK